MAATLMKTPALRQRLLAGLLALAAPLAWAAHAEDEANAKLKKQADNAFWWGDFAEMERLYLQHNQPEKAPGAGPGDAYQRLRNVRNGFDRVLERSSARKEPYLAELDALTLQWAKQNPASSLAHVLHTQVLIKRAWAYRGDGYAKSVPPQAWADFEKYITQARDYLGTQATVALKDSGAYWTVLMIGRASGWDLARQKAVANEGLKINPGDLSLYHNVLTSTLPKWQGDTDQVERYVSEVVATTKASRGMEMYARLYASAAHEEYQHRLFENSHATWPKMKAGYEDLLKRDPRPYNHNAMAYFACLAKDKDTFLVQLEAIDREKPDLDAWGSNPRYTYDTCKRWATQL